MTMTALWYALTLAFLYIASWLTVNVEYDGLERIMIMFVDIAAVICFYKTLTEIFGDVK